MASDIKYEIVRHIAVLSDKGSGWTREVNLVRWNDGGVKLDIRDWSADRSKMKRGITLNRFEFLNLVKAARFIDANDIAEHSFRIDPNGEAPAGDGDGKTAAVDFPEQLDKAVNA